MLKIITEIFNLLLGLILKSQKFIQREIFMLFIYLIIALCLDALLLGTLKFVATDQTVLQGLLKEAGGSESVLFIRTFIIVSVGIYTFRILWSMVSGLLKTPTDK